MRWAALLLLLILPQDPAEKVRALMEKSGSEEITEREKALADLVALGPSAIPHLRALLAKSTGAQKSRIDAVLQKIERNQAVANLMAPGPKITLKAKDKPAGEVFAELTSQTGVPVEGQDLPAGTLLSLEADNLTLPQAVDELCRTHGRLMYTWSYARVVIRSAPYRKVACFDKGPYRVIIDRFDWITHAAGTNRENEFSAEGGLLAPPGRFPLTVEFLAKEALDDKGVNLTEGFHSSRVPNVEIEPDGQRTFKYLFWDAGTPPSREATRLKSFRGEVRLSFAIGAKRVLTVKAPLSEPTGAATNRATTLELLGWKWEDGRLKAEWRLTRRSSDSLERLEAIHKNSRLVLHDAAGKRWDGKIESESRGDNSTTGASSWEVREGKTTFEIPKDADIATLDLVELEFHEELIPFDLGEVPLR